MNQNEFARRVALAWAESNAVSFEGRPDVFSKRVAGIVRSLGRPTLLQRVKRWIRERIHGAPAPAPNHHQV